MTVQQLRAFLAVADTLSFAQASECLHRSQSALSLTIKTLEQNLGGALFLRTTRQVVLTREGEQLLAAARHLVADWDRTEQMIKGRFSLQQGDVTLAAMPAFAANVLPPILRRFRESHPHVQIRVHDVINEQVMEMVQAHRVELGIVFQPPDASPLSFEPLYQDRFVAVVPADDELAGSAAVSWPQLLQRPFIALQSPSVVRSLVDAALAAHPHALPVAIESHQLTTVGRMVACGLGVSAVPAMCRDQMEALGARCVALHDPQVSRAVGLLTRGPDQLSAAAQAFCQLLRDARLDQLF
ncbi:LysR family transcriptional regulator [Isoalcanivorax beigongshangi]|uniref:LysR family transcriptional regulator n=1 Tax=Isoalcanivorax beigongshangi TaxID=3238810 RepID=A0ABV4AFM6_9GAMM